MTPNPQPWRPTRVDLVVSAVTTVAMLFLVGIASEEGSRPPDPIAYTVAALVGIVLLLRRRYPTVVAVATLVLVFAYHVLGYPAIGNLPLAVALFSASYHSAMPSAITIGLVAVIGSLAWFLIGEARSVAEAVNFVVRETGILAVAILLGAVLRSRQRLAEESEERLRLVRADQEARSASRMAEERMSIAREIHDVLSHTVALIGVQAKVALEALHDDSTEDVAKALTIIDDSTRNAATELRATVGVLRSQPSLSPAPRLDQLGSLADSLSTGDLAVELYETGERRELSGLVELVSFRVVQEALTNVMKHAGASRALVRVDFDRSGVEISVSDNGRGGDIREGHGIAGMRERVNAVGGTLSIGPSDAGGLEVVARLPGGEAR